MTRRFAAALGLSISLFALAGVLPMEALAQTGKAIARGAVDAGIGKAPKAGPVVAAEASNADMRLWSFGECDKNFPYFDTPEHKECVRLVGSEEARDARAAHFCDSSHDTDRAAATRCKEAYLANKSKAEQEGLRGSPSNLPPVLAPAAPQPDQATAIAAVTRALKAPDPDEPAAPAAPTAETTPAPPPAPASGFSAGNITLGLAIVLLLAAVGMRYVRKMAAAKGAAKVTSREGRRSKTTAGTSPKK
jgi:hypothetical protein